MRQPSNMFIAREIINELRQYQSLFFISNTWNLIPILSCIFSRRDIQRRFKFQFLIGVYKTPIIFKKLKWILALFITLRIEAPIFTSIHIKVFFCIYISTVYYIEISWENFWDIFTFYSSSYSIEPLFLEFKESINNFKLEISNS